MNGKSVVFLAAIIVLAAGCGPKTDDPGDIAALKALDETYLRAVNAGDAAAVSSLYAEDAVRLGPNAPALVGREAIRASYQNHFDLFQNEEADVIEDVRVIGDLAVVRGTYANRIVPKVPGPAVTDDRGKWIAVSRRQTDGSWKFVLDTWNTDLPQGLALYPGGEDERAILKIELDWAAALMHQDAAALELFMADVFVENRAGALTKKKDLITALKSARSRPNLVEVGDLRILVFGEFGVVNGRGLVIETRAGKEIVENFRFVDTFQKQDGIWKAVSAFLVPEK